MAQPAHRAGTGVRRRRRAVGPAGARPAQEADLAVLSDDEPGRSDDADTDEHLRREVPPHHGD